MAILRESHMHPTMCKLPRNEVAMPLDKLLAIEHEQGDYDVTL